MRWGPCVLHGSCDLGGPASAGDGVVALQTAAPTCPDDSGDRYVDCDNGTVTDNETGLVWLANADCFGGWAGLRQWLRSPGCRTFPTTVLLVPP